MAPEKWTWANDISATFVAVCMELRIALVVAGALKELPVMGCLPMTGTVWTGGGACLPAIEMALRHINERADILAEYKLTYSWADTQCNAGLATYKMFEYLQAPPTKLMLLGCLCSTESEATAQVSHLFNITQLSSGSSSPILSDRKRFPNFFRLAGPDQKLNPAKIALMNKFNWKKVATINQALEFFSVVIDDFVKSLKGTDIAIISQEIFEHDPLTRIENLKRRDARIIVTACYEDKARLMLCEREYNCLSSGCGPYQAYKVGLYGPKIVWMFYGWFSTEFWRQKLEDIPCTQEEMEQAADGAFVIGYYFRNRVIERGVAGITVPEFEVLYKQEETYDPSKYNYEIISGQCYDHVWVAALALNCTDAYLKSTGHPKSLDTFSYSDSDINEVILSCMSNVSMTGITGSINFEEGADPIKDAKIERIQDGHRVTVGTYIMTTHPRYFEWTTETIQWKDDFVPRDSTYITYVEVSIPFELYVTMSALAVAGIVLTCSFLVFNVIHRNNRIVKLSSPNINNIMLLGCALTYSTVILKPTDMRTAHICKARTCCFSLGFTIALGALFSKTWRVYRIFTNKKLLKVAIKDYQLIGIISAMVGVIVGIILIWEIVSPQAIETVLNEVYTNGNDAEVYPFVKICYSKYGAHFAWTIYVTEGALLGFGAFLAWESRHIKIEALNDSHQIGMCIYNVVVLSAVGLSLSLLLEDQVIRMYAVTSGCVLIGTTTTQLIVFIPKVLAVYRHHSVGTTNVVPFDSSTGAFKHTATATGSNSRHHNFGRTLSMNNTLGSLSK